MLGLIVDCLMVKEVCFITEEDTCAATKPFSRLDSTCKHENEENLFGFHYGSFHDNVFEKKKTDFLISQMTLKCYYTYRSRML